MNDDAPWDGQPLEAYHSFVAWLARVRLDPAFCGPGGVVADDLVQETMLKAHRSRADFRGSTCREFKAWLRVIFLRTLADALQKRARDPVVGAAAGSWSACIEDFFVAEHTSPSEHARRNELALKLEEALAELPERQAEAVQLRYLHGWKVPAIARKLEISRTAAAGLLKRGLHELRTRLPVA